MADADPTILFAKDLPDRGGEVYIEVGKDGPALCVDAKRAVYLWHSIDQAAARRIVEALMPFAYPVGEEGDRLAKLPSEPPRDTLHDLEQP